MSTTFLVCYLRVFFTLFFLVGFEFELIVNPSRQHSSIFEAMYTKTEVMNRMHVFIFVLF